MTILGYTNDTTLHAALHANSMGITATDPIYLFFKTGVKVTHIISHLEGMQTALPLNVLEALF